MTRARRNRHLPPFAPLLLLVTSCSDASHTEAGASNAGPNDSAHDSDDHPTHDDETETEGNQDNDDNNDTDTPIIRSDWQLIIDTEFIDARTTEPITRLQLGTAPQNRNFTNRGDIEVHFSTATHIKVEIRKTVVGESRDNANKLMDRYKFWAWAVDQPAPPEQLLAADPDAKQRCENGHWRDACIISAYYDGDRQPDALGIEFRVSLPRAWERTLKIRTQDMVADPENYPERGDVEVFGLRGLLEVQGQSGLVDIERAADALEVVDCPEPDYATCIASEWQDIGGENCSCGRFANVLVRMQGSAEVRVALNHSGLLNQFKAENLQAGLDPEKSPYCDVSLQCDQLDDCDVEAYEAREKRWQLNINANIPAPAQTGIGANFDIKTASCSEVNFVDDPEDFGKVRTEVRGTTSICVGALSNCPRP